MFSKRFYIVRIQRRNELFAVSGKSGDYPQFFISEHNGSTMYLGQWNELEYLVTSEYDLLRACLATQDEAHFSPVDANSMLCETAELAPLETSMSTEYCSHVPNEGLLTLLISSGVCDRTQDSNQNAALQLLRDFKVPFKLVDGMSADDFER